MPRGPKGEKRPADVIGNAVHVMRIATGEIEEQENPPQRNKQKRRRRFRAVRRARQNFPQYSEQR